MEFRIEKDTMGEVKVPIHRYWGAQTERSRNNFKIGNEASMPKDVIYAFAILKKAAAKINFKFNLLSQEKMQLISMVCDEILHGKLDDEFPLVIWQTGSGTQTNMNLNEVIANRAHVIHGGKLSDEKKILSPNDDVNRSQSSNDTFPTAMHIAAYHLVHARLLPELNKIEKMLALKVFEFKNIVKTGRTHFMDATPLTLGQEFSAYRQQVINAKKSIQQSLEGVLALAIGGTAVGTGLNAPKGFDVEVAKEIAKLTTYPFVSADNKFEALATNDALVELSGALKKTAVTFMKITNDIRMLSSGPRSGIGEIHIPDNEPGSSIMPGKVNPTQVEALSMICTKVIGNDVTVAIAGSNGHFQLNVFKPVIIASVLESIQLLADGIGSFSDHCLEGITPNLQQIDKNLQQSLMLVTALNPHIGYYKSAEIAQKAYRDGISLKEAALALAYVSEADFDKWVNPNLMI